MKEKKARVEDALQATRAAVEEGIVPGGGVALLRCLAAMDTVKPENDDERIGVDIVKRAVEYPTRVLADNAGMEGSVVVQEVKRRKGGSGQSRRSRSEEGHARRIAERGLDCRSVADHRMPGHRDSGGGENRFTSWRHGGHGWHGWHGGHGGHGGHGLLSPFGFPGGIVNRERGWKASASFASGASVALSAKEYAANPSEQFFFLTVAL